MAAGDFLEVYTRPGMSFVFTVDVFQLTHSPSPPLFTISWLPNTTHNHLYTISAANWFIELCSSVVT